MARMPFSCPVFLKSDLILAPVLQGASLETLQLPTDSSDVLAKLKCPREQIS